MCQQYPMILEAKSEVLTRLRGYAGYLGLRGLYIPEDKFTHGVAH